jgi:hypothetical protein
VGVKRGCGKISEVTLPFSKQSIKMSDKIILAKPIKKFAQRYWYPEYAAWYENACPILARHNKVETLEVPDIWVRDFIPEHGKFMLFYDPIYNNKEFHKEYAEIRERVLTLYPNATKANIRMEWGNLVYRGGVGIAIDNKTFFTDETALKEMLNLEKIIWLPPAPRSIDPISHADGYMQFVGNTLLLAEGSGIEKQYLEIIKRETVNLSIDFLPNMAAANANPLSAKGIYTNFLETDKAVFVPQYDLLSDEAAIETIKKHTSKPVIEINCAEISKHGGSLHCLTKEIPEN